MAQVTLSRSNSVVRDTFISASNPTTAYGSATTVNISNVPLRGLMYFDLGLIPNDAVINSATLRLYNVSANVGVSLDILRLTSAFDNNTTWSTAPSFDSQVYASKSTPAQNNSFDFDIKSLVQQWVNGTYQNHGIMIKLSNEAQSNSVQLASFDDGNTSYRPTLIIDYTIPSTGKKQVEYVGTSYQGTSGMTTSLTINMPAGIQAGDLLVAQLVHPGYTNTLNPPAGWTKYSEDDITGANFSMVTLTKVATGGETSETFTLGGTTGVYWLGAIHAFRNVKEIERSSVNLFTTTTISITPLSTTADGADRLALFLIAHSSSSSNAVTPPLSHAEKVDFAHSNAGRGLFASIRYLHDKTDVVGTDNVASFSSGSYQSIARMLVLEPISNNEPTLTLTSPTDNQTLAEGNTLPVEGSASDADSGNVVTVKYKINSGTTRALTSGVSDGSSPLSFAKTLTYSSKRIWDGSTDVAGADLAENTDHTLTVWSEDDQGGKSAEVTRTFKVIWNRPPAIDGSDSNLGAIGTAPSINYTVTEPEGDSFTITELLNGQQIRSFAGVAGQQNTATIDQDRWLRLALGVQHELRIRATDSKGQFADRIYTFTRTETQIQFDLKNPFLCDAKPTRVLVTLDGTFPDGSTVLVEVCNNAYDAVPAYEDATGPSLAGRGYIFTNETKTAADWGINIRITINRGTATEKVILNGFGGAFD